jgi:hypothetical protein
MHNFMLEQLAADRVAELWADAQRVRNHRVHRVHRVRRAFEPRESLARRQWRVLVHNLMAR